MLLTFCPSSAFTFGDFVLNESTNRPSTINTETIICDGWWINSFYFELKNKTTIFRMVINHQLRPDVQRGLFPLEYLILFFFREFCNNFYYFEGILWLNRNSTWTTISSSIDGFSKCIQLFERFSFGTNREQNREKRGGSDLRIKCP